MPKLDGFDVLELIGGDVPVVFVTAYDEFALRAFEVHAVDYLLKPFSRERLRGGARSRARAARDAGGRRRRRCARARGRRARRSSAWSFATARRCTCCRCDKIDYVEAQDDYVGVSHGRARSLLKEQTLGDLEAQLDPRRFVRIHRSYLLNIERLCARRAVREGQPRRDSDGRHEAAGQPVGVSAVAAAAVSRPLDCGSLSVALCALPTARRLRRARASGSDS